VRGGPKLRRVVEEVWALAQDESTRPISEEEFLRLVAAMERVQAALAAGAVTWPRK
jgi:hypothetical protein